jgi:hypothetical protein
LKTKRSDYLCWFKTVEKNVPVNKRVKFEKRILGANNKHETTLDALKSRKD